MRRTQFELWTIERQEIGFLFTFVSSARIVTFQDRLYKYVFPVYWDVIRFSGKGSKRSVELRGKKEAENGYEQTVACDSSQKKKTVS